MTLGEKLKQLRNHKNLSQPELAELANIEQSYLSKLENDKSIPSNDIFRRLLKALGTEVSSFTAEFQPSYVRSTLCQIPDIEANYYQQQASQKDKSRRLLIVSSLIIVLATTLFYTGISSVLFPDRQYSYESQGVILEGEPIDVFEGGIDKITPIKDESWVKSKAELAKRYYPHHIVIDKNRGSVFTEYVEGGRRTYYRSGELEITPPQNAVLQILGVMFFAAGVMGFVFEFRMSRYGKG